MARAPVAAGADAVRTESRARLATKGDFLSVGRPPPPTSGEVPTTAPPSQPPRTPSPRPAGGGKASAAPGAFGYAGGVRDRSGRPAAVLVMLALAGGCRATAPAAPPTVLDPLTPV